MASQSDNNVTVRTVTIEWEGLHKQEQEFSLDAHQEVAEYVRLQYDEPLTQERRVMATYLGSTITTAATNQFNQQLLDYDMLLCNFKFTLMRHSGSSKSLIDHIRKLQRVIKLLNPSGGPTSDPEELIRLMKVKKSSAAMCLREVVCRLSEFRGLDDDIQYLYQQVTKERNALLDQVSGLPTPNDVVCQNMIVKMGTVSQEMEALHHAYLIKVSAAKNTFEGFVDLYVRTYDFGFDLHEQFCDDDDDAYLQWLVRPVGEIDTPDPSAWDDEFVSAIAAAAASD